MLQDAYLLATFVADTAENEPMFAKFLAKSVILHPVRIAYMAVNALEWKWKALLSATCESRRIPSCSCSSATGSCRSGSRSLCVPYRYKTVQM